MFYFGFMDKSYLEDRLYKSAIKKAEESGDRKPDQVVMQVVIPMDCYEAFIRRFYEDPPLRFRHTDNKVTKTDIISYLMWLWGTKTDVDLTDNIFDQVDPGATRVYKPNKKFEDKRGRKATKHLVDLFEEDQEPEGGVDEGNASDSE